MSGREGCCGVKERRASSEEEEEEAGLTWKERENLGWCEVMVGRIAEITVLFCRGDGW